jgi:hypothetical protein
LIPAFISSISLEVNLMPGGEGWRTPKDSWMDLEDAGDEVYFVNVRLRGEEDKAGIEAGADPAKAESDKEMERELVRAEAAVDLNIHKRAKKAGVEVLTSSPNLSARPRRLHLGRLPWLHEPQPRVSSWLVVSRSYSS